MGLTGNKNDKNGKWEISRLSSGYWVNIPTTYKSYGYSEWAKLQAKIIERFTRFWQNTHMYIRLDTYFLPEHILSAVNRSQVVKTIDLESHQFIVLLEDIDDTTVWEKVLNTGIAVDYGRMFILSSEIINDWAKKLDEIFNIVAKTHFIPADFRNEAIDKCLLICSSFDKSIYVEKVELSEYDVFETLNAIAKEEQLEIWS